MFFPKAVTSTAVFLITSLCFSTAEVDCTEMVKGDNSLKVSKILENYARSQGNALCPFTFSGIELLEFLSSKNNRESLNDHLVRSPIKISQRIADMGRTQLPLTREASVAKSKRFGKYCETFVVFVPEVRGEIIQSMVDVGAPARHRFVLILRHEKDILKVIQDPQFYALRLVCVYILDSDVVVTKVPEASNRIVQLRTSFDTLPKFLINVNNLNGVHFRLSAIPIPPFLIRGPSGRFDRGLAYNLYSTAARQYNFTFEFVFPVNAKDGTGKELPNGTWTGLLGELNQGRADLVIAVSPAPDRLFGPFEFTDMYLAVNGEFAVAHPEVALRWNTLLKPFQRSTWVAIALSFAMFFLAVYVRLSVALGHGPWNLNGSRLIKNKFSVAAFLPLALLLEKSVPKIPRKIRLLTSVWLFFALIVGTGYKERLFAYMTFPEYEEIPRTARQLAAMPEYTVLYSWWPSVQYFTWEKSTQPHMKNIFQRFRKVPSAFECVVKTAFEPKTVCVAYKFEILSGMAANLTYDSDFQPLYMTDERYFEAYITIPFKRGSIFVDSWKKIVSSLRDFGLPTRWMMNEIKQYRSNGASWLRKHPEDSLAFEIKKLKSRESKVTKSLSLNDFRALILLYLVTIGVSIVGFVWERKSVCIGRRVSEVLAVQEVEQWPVSVNSPRNRLREVVQEVCKRIGFVAAIRGPEGHYGSSAMTPSLKRF